MVISGRFSFLFPSDWLYHLYFTSISRNKVAVSQKNNTTQRKTDINNYFLTLKTMGSNKLFKVSINLNVVRREKKAHNC